MGKFSDMKKVYFTVAACLSALLTIAQSANEFKVTHTIHIKSDGWWDYIAVNEGKVYVSHGTQVNVLSAASGDSIGVIPNTNGVHGIAFDQALHKGFTSNGRSNNVTVFDLSTNSVKGTIATGENPDAITYEPYTKTIITCNGRSKDLTVIDPRSEKVVATVKVDGKPETGVSDGKGHFFVNIEDKNEIEVVDLKNYKVTAQWPLAPGTSPTGLAIDTHTGQLFAGCDDKLLVVVDAATGKVVKQLPIGDGCDGVAFDERRKLIYASCGEGVLTVIKEKGAGQFEVLGNYPTKRGARTLAVDESTGAVYLPTAEFGTAEKGTRPPMVPGSFQVLVVK